MFTTEKKAWCDNKQCRKMAVYTEFNAQPQMDKMLCPHCGFKTLTPFGMSKELEAELLDNLYSSIGEVGI